VEIELSEIGVAEYKNKTFPLLRDLGKLNLTTRDGDEYSIHGPEELLKSVNERFSQK